MIGNRVWIESGNILQFPPYVCIYLLLNDWELCRGNSKKSFWKCRRVLTWLWLFCLWPWLMLCTCVFLLGNPAYMSKVCAITFRLFFRLCSGMWGLGIFVCRTWIWRRGNSIDGVGTQCRHEVQFLFLWYPVVENHELIYRLYVYVITYRYGYLNANTYTHVYTDTQSYMHIREHIYIVLTWV